MEQQLKALIVDDEEGARRLLAKLPKETQCFHEIQMAKSVTSSNYELIQLDPDIIFPDIKMLGKDGFSIIQELELERKQSEIVIVTAYEQYVIQAIKHYAFDYLLKPVNRKELKLCVLMNIESRKDGKLHERKVNSAEPLEKISRIRVNTRTGVLFINPATILYCKTDGNYTTICTGKKRHLCSMNLGKVEE